MRIMAPIRWNTLLTVVMGVIVVLVLMIQSGGRATGPSIRPDGYLHAEKESPWQTASFPDPSS